MADRFLTPESVKAGTTSVSLMVKIVVESTGAGVTGLAAADVNASYWRQGGSRVAITEADLSAITDAWSAGGWFEVDATNMPGIYRLDVPDAAFATGADWVVVTVVESGSQTFIAQIALPTLATLADSLLDTIIESEGSYTVQQALSVMLSALAGVSSTGGTIRKTPNGVATRISATINPSNERTAMTLTPSS